MGQVVSEVGDHFNTLAVQSLALHLTGSGLAVGGVMLARTLPYLLGGPVAGVALDRFDRKTLMIASDLCRAAIALAFILIIALDQSWLMYVLSAMLMFASPFFTSGRAAILPSITSPEELHVANTLSQTTAWLTLSVGALLGGLSASTFGYDWAFIVNSASFLFSAWAIWRLKGDFRPDAVHHEKRHFWADFHDGVLYIRRTPVVFAVAVALFGWSMGGGAAQILFTLYGEVVFAAGPLGFGLLWSSAGLGLVVGGLIALRIGRNIEYEQYKRVIFWFFVLHGGAYVLFAVSPGLGWAMLFVGLSRTGMGANNVLNRGMLLITVPDQYRGRVFSSMETLVNVAMTASMALASIASVYWSVRTIGIIAGLLSTSTALLWWLQVRGERR
jgi:MFS family permease